MTMDIFPTQLYEADLHVSTLGYLIELKCDTGKGLSRKDIKKDISDVYLYRFAERGLNQIILRVLFFCAFGDQWCCCCCS